MEPAPVATGIAQRAQGQKKAFGLLAAQGIFDGISHAFKRGPSRWHDGGGENLASFGSEAMKEDGFGFLVELIEVDPGAAEAFGDSDFNPMGGAVTGAFEAFGIDEGLNQGDRMTVALLPILTQALEVQA
jgi:hypothetical protein